MTQTSVNEQASQLQLEEDDLGEPTPSFEAPPEAEHPPLVQTSEFPLGAMATIPRAGSSPFQEQLAISNAAARADSVRRLAGWFPGYDFAEAAQNVDSRRF